METGNLVASLLIIVFGGGGIWAWRKINAETVGGWAATANKLRDRLDEQDNELEEQRMRRQELADTVEVQHTEIIDLKREGKRREGRVQSLSAFIVTNIPGIDPRDINGPIEGTPI